MPTPIKLDEDAVRQVLARAVELERQHGTSLTEVQVRDIARELAIPPAAIDQALAEYRAGAVSAGAVSAPPQRWRARVVLTVIGIVLVGLALAFVALRTVPAPLP